MGNLRSYVLILACLLLTRPALAQLVIDVGYSPQQLVEDVLVGSGVQVSNIQYTGSVAARGYFNGSNSNIGLAAGVILSTGRAVDAVGPNVSPAGTEWGTDFGLPGNALLTGISGSTTHDAAVLEFDFIPVSDTLKFRYVFASDEYMTYVGTAGINDLFAFFISGPNITGEQNIGLIPGTTTPVTMVNVNADTNSQFYVDNGDEGGDIGGETVSYNGFTTVFTAQAIVEPCQTYHIRLALADAGDGSFDSAVFLEEGSFSTPTISMEAEASFSASSSDIELVEGCSSMSLTFERSAPFDAALTTGLTITGTATVGIDVTSIPNTVTFPAGQPTVTITFDVLEDGVAEGPETLTIQIDQPNPCAGGAPTAVTVTIVDAVPMTLQITPSVTSICPEQRTIEVTVSGGYPNYEFSWSGSSETTSSITVFPFSTTVYEVDVTDACGFTASASTTISIANYQPPQVVLEDAVVCGGEEVTLMADVTGGLGTISYLWNGSATTETYTLSPTTDVVVTLQVTDDCNITAETSANVAVDGIVPSFTHQLTAHSTLQFTNTTDNIGSSFWDFGDSMTSDDDDPRHEYLEPGDYIVTLTVTNTNGCEAIVQDTVTAYPPFHIYIPNSFTPNGDGLNDVYGLVGEGYLYYDLEIYDSWGKLLRHGRFRDDTAWDGTVNGRLVPSGAYVYRVWVQPPIGIEVREAGVLYVLPGQE